MNSSFQNVIKTQYEVSPSKSNASSNLSQVSLAPSLPVLLHFPIKKKPCWGEEKTSYGQVNLQEKKGSGSSRFDSEESKGR